MQKSKTYNKYYLRANRASKKLNQLYQANQTDLDFLGDVIGALSLFGAFFVALFFAAVFS